VGSHSSPALSAVLPASPCPSCSCRAPAAAGRYSLSLHDALPISPVRAAGTGQVATTSSMTPSSAAPSTAVASGVLSQTRTMAPRSEEHTSELQSRFDLVCRLLLEKKQHTPADGAATPIEHYLTPW